jgi:hypothetical protein
MGITRLRPVGGFRAETAGSLMLVGIARVSSAVLGWLR